MLEQKRKALLESGPWWLELLDDDSMDAIAKDVLECDDEDEPDESLAAGDQQ